MYLRNLALCFTVFVLVTSGCESDSTTGPDLTPPAPPRGLWSITGDGKVTLEWYENTEPDLAGYRIWYSYTDEGPYELMGETTSTVYVDYDVENSITYYYAVSAYDYEGNESDLNPELIFDTPRPEGRGVTLWSYRSNPNRSGLYFSEGSAVVPYDDIYADVYYDHDPDSEIGYIVAVNSDPPTQMQDYGYTRSLEDVDWAPEAGWSNLGWAEAIQGHAYVIWTWDNHFAAMRITDVQGDHIVIDWSYQASEGNPELKGVPGFLRR